MKKFLFILVTIPFAIYAQEETTPKRKIYLGLSNGLWFNTNYDLSNNEWKKMLPDWTYFDSVDNVKTAIIGPYRLFGMAEAFS